MGKQLVFREFGPATEVLELEFKIKIPEELAAGEVLVRIIATPLNPADLNTIEGTYGVKPALPAAVGIEGCGRVVTSNANNFKTGDLVIFLQPAATWATHRVLPETALLKLPDTIDPLQAALLKVNPATAWLLLHHFELLKPGDWIVQNLGNSAVGRCVIQLARDLGIRTISFVRRANCISELTDLGADQVFSDDVSGYTSALEILNGPNAALAFNAVGGDSALRLMKLLRESGSHITYGAMARKPLTLPNGLLIFRDIRVRGLWVSRWIANAPIHEVVAVYESLAARVIAGKLLQPIDSTFPLEDFQQALARLGAPSRAGKVLFVP